MVLPIVTTESTERVDPGTCSVRVTSSTKVGVWVSSFILDVCFPFGCQEWASKVQSGTPRISATACQPTITVFGSPPRFRSFSKEGKGLVEPGRGNLAAGQTATDESNLRAECNNKHIATRRYNQHQPTNDCIQPTNTVPLDLLNNQQWPSHG